MFSFLKQSYSPQSRLVGPFIDDTNFKDLETGLTINNTDVKLSKNGGGYVDKNSGGGTHVANGMYSLTFNTTDTSDVGELAGSISVSGALVVTFKFWVLEEDIYDALFGASAAGFDSDQRVDVSKIEGSDATTQIQSSADAALVAKGLDHLVSASVTGSDITDNSIIARLTSKSATADWDSFDNTTDSLEAIADATGGGLTQMIYPVPLIPSTIDMANTAAVRIGLGVVNMLDDLPTTGEITPGTITIDRKATGGTSWTTVVNAANCLEAAGLIYYDEVFDSGSGYRPGDTIRITFKNQMVTADSNDYELVPTDGWIFHTYVRGVERTDTTNAAHTYTVLDSGSNPIADVLVEAKINGILVQSARTDTNGDATFYLAPGEYDFYATKAGYSFNNPDTETVS